MTILIPTSAASALSPLSAMVLLEPRQLVLLLYHFANRADRRIQGDHRQVLLPEVLAAVAGQGGPLLGPREDLLAKVPRGIEAQGSEGFEDLLRVLGLADQPRATVTLTK